MYLEPDDIDFFLSDSFEIVSLISNDDVDSVKTYIEKFPETLNFLDDYNNNLLHISIILDKYETFKYLLSLEHFNLEAVNNNGATVLAAAILTNSEDFTENYALDLIKKGANLQIICFNDNNYLHLALMNHRFLIAETLIEKGVDIDVKNSDGCTPLHMVFHKKASPEAVNEGVCLMLYYGADVTIYDNNGNLPFDLAVIYDPSIIIAQENLFFCTFDERSDYVMSSEVLFELLECESPLFLQIADYVSDVFFVKRVYFSPVVFFKMKLEVLEIIITRFDYIISSTFLENSPVFWYDISLGSFQNWEFLLNSKLASDTIEFVKRIKLELVIEKLEDENVERRQICDFIFYLLSYGLNVFEKDLDSVYKNYGYCDLFKLLLHMEVKPSTCDIIPRIIFDLALDLDGFLDDPCNYSLNAVEELLSYFARPKLKNFCYELNVDRLVRKAEGLPGVPSLVECARDVARGFLVEKFNAKTCRDFYWGLNKLPISFIHRRILSFESKLYRW